MHENHEAQVFEEERKDFSASVRETTLEARCEVSETGMLFDQFVGQFSSFLVYSASTRTHQTAQPCGKVKTTTTTYMHRKTRKHAMLLDRRFFSLCARIAGNTIGGRSQKLCFRILVALSNWVPLAP